MYKPKLCRENYQKAVKSANVARPSNFFDTVLTFFPLPLERSHPCGSSPRYEFRAAKSACLAN
jgi:hypothetical protein